MINTLVPFVKRSARPLALLVILVLFLVLALFAAYRRHAGGERPGSSTRAVPPLGNSAMTIVPGAHILGGLFPSAAYVVETADGLILVDSGLDDEAGPLRSQMAELGLDWRRVRAILLTHAHGDHTGGAQWLRTSTGATVYAGRGDAAVLEAGGPREAFFSTFHMPDHRPHPTTVDVALAGGETIAMGDVRIEALATPGHTPGSICYRLERGTLRVLFGGDTIMSLQGREPPRTELDKPLGTYSAYLPPGYRGDAREFLGSLRRLRALPVPDLVLPGHPRAAPVPTVPALSQARWESMLDRGIRDMEVLLARHAADGPDFLDGAPKHLLPDLDYLGDFRGSAVYGFFAASRFFLVNAPGGPGLVEFVNDRLRQLGRPPARPAAVLLTASGVEETAGLPELIARCAPEVFAASTCLDRLRRSCPAGTVVLPARELAGKGWFTVETIELDGRGRGPIAYRITLDGKAVMFSGRIAPALNQESRQRLIEDLAGPSGNLHAYFDSIARLGPLEPDLWLPAVPVAGQNANLYDDDWRHTIEDNRELVRALIRGSSSQ